MRYLNILTILMYLFSADQDEERDNLTNAAVVVSEIQ